MNLYRTCTLTLLCLVGQTLSPARAQEAAHPLFPDDARLAKPVTLEIQNQPLGAVLASLAQKGGTRLEVKPDSDWEPVIVLAKDRSVRELMAGLGALENMSWTQPPTSQETPRYRLSKGIRAKDAEEALLGRHLEEAAKPLFHRSYAVEEGIGEKG